MAGRLLSCDGLKVICRADAIASGAATYYTGEPCRKGHLSPRRADSGSCLACQSERHKSEAFKQYDKTRREQKTRNATAYRRRHPDRVKASKKASDKKNSDRVRTWARRWADENRDRYNDVKRAYRDANIESARASNLRWQRANKDKTKAQKHKRRAAIRDQEIETFSVRSIFDRDRWVCGLCGRKVDSRLKYPDPNSVSLDHIIPIAEGGGHTRRNVQCAHLLCNRQKGAKPRGQMLLFG